MLINHQWCITKLQVKPTFENIQNVVVCAEWELTSTAEDGISVQRIGVETFNFQPEDFTPFNKLTEQQVLGWVNQQVNKKLSELMHEEAIEQKRNPPVIEKSLPWVTAN